MKAARFNASFNFKSGFILISALTVACLVSMLGVSFLSNLSSQQAFVNQYYLKLKLINYLNERHQQFFETLAASAAVSASNFKGSENGINYQHHLTKVFNTLDLEIWELDSLAQIHQVKAKVTQTLMYFPLQRAFKLGSYRLD